jgi:hypothetical protein
MKTINWKEEVRLIGGQTIVVERSQDYRRVYSGGPFRPGWLREQERLNATLQSPRREIKWEGKPIPLALDVAPDGNIYLVAVTTAGTSGENEYGRKLQPNETYYVAYQLGVDQTQWRRIQITAVPSEFQPNMMVDTHGLFIQKGSTATFVDLALKAKVDSDPRISRTLRDWPRK